MEGKRANNTRVITGIVLAAAVFVGTAIYLGVNTLGDGDNSVSVAVPLIETKLTSAADGQEYKVQTLFSVKMDNRARRSLTNSMLEETLSGIMEQMSVDEIMAAEGVSYLNDRATEMLNDYLSARNITTRVVVTDIATGDRVRLTNPNGAGDRQKGLFQKIN